MLHVAEHAARTDVGRQRPANEDSHLARSPLFVVADGMGGAQAGEVASRLAVEAFEEGVAGGAAGLSGHLAERVVEANRRIHRLARADERRAGMGTTLTAAVLEGRDVVVAHVGDSRLYRLRGTTLERITRDHSLVEELVRQGRLTPEEAEEHPQRSIITRALGPEDDVQVDELSVSARAGDVYLLCSDGLTSMVGERQLDELLRAHGAATGQGDLATAADALVDAANAAGGRDNITVLLFRVDDDGSDDGPEEPTASHDAVGPPTDATRVLPAVGAPASAEDARRAPAGDGVRPDGGVTRGVPLQRREPRTGRRRGPRLSAGPFLLLFLLSGVVAAAWFASQTVYFVGASRGLVSVYRGLPYDLPLGLDLYTLNYESSVPVAAVPPGGRAALSAHEIRSLRDANALIDGLERRGAGVAR